MNSSGQRIPPIGGVPSEAAGLFRSQLIRIWTATAIVGTIVVLVSGAIVLFADWFSTYHFLRLWQQLSATFGGCVLLATAVVMPPIRRLRQFLLSITGLLLLLAVWDSLDGMQQFLPTVALLLWFWATIYISTIAEIHETSQVSDVRQRWTIGIGLIASTIYLGAASYYVVINYTRDRVQIDSHPLYGFGIVIATLLQWLGGMHPYRTNLSGNVRVCRNCGLRNIPERSSCKRCGTMLGAIEAVT